MSSAHLDDFAVCIETLDVNRLADAMNAAKLISKEHPGVIFSEVDSADHEVREAVKSLLKARHHLSAALGRMMLAERSKTNAA